jgi:hypothetical protein
MVTLGGIVPAEVGLMSIEQLSTSARSRRAVLAASLTGMAALAARAMGRPEIAEAHDPQDIGIGLNNPSTSITELSNSSNDSLVFWGQSTQGGTGIYGSSASGTGVLAFSGSGSGARGDSTLGTGVYGTSTSGSGVHGASAGGDGITGVSGSSLKSGMWGSNSAGGYGVSGSTNGSATAGVWGSNSGGGTGVRGTAVSGRGVHGKSTSGYAGYFEGKVFTTKYFDLKEINTPAPPSANLARLFTRDNGSGATQLCVKFSNGVVRVLATM